MHENGMNIIIFLFHEPYSSSGNFSFSLKLFNDDNINVYGCFIKDVTFSLTEESYEKNH